MDKKNPENQDAHQYAEMYSVNQALRWRGLQLHTGAGWFNITSKEEVVITAPDGPLGVGQLLLEIKLAALYGGVPSVNPLRKKREVLDSAVAEYIRMGLVSEQATKRQTYIAVQEALMKEPVEMSFVDYVVASGLTSCKVKLGKGVAAFGKEVHPFGVSHDGFWFPTGTVVVEVPDFESGEEERFGERVKAQLVQAPVEAFVVQQAVCVPATADCAGSIPRTTDAHCATLLNKNILSFAPIRMSVAARRTVLHQVKPHGYVDQTTFYGLLAGAIVNAGGKGTEEEVYGFCSATAGAFKQKSGLVNFT